MKRFQGAFRKFRVSQPKKEYLKLVQKGLFFRVGRGSNPRGAYARLVNYMLPFANWGPIRYKVQNSCLNVQFFLYSQSVTSYYREAHR